jgi:hypothetical protein
MELGYGLRYTTSMNALSSWKSSAVLSAVESLAVVSTAENASAVGMLL